MTLAEVKAYNQAVNDCRDELLKMTVYIEGRRIALYGVRQILKTLLKPEPRDGKA